MRLKFKARRLKRLNALLVKGRKMRWPKPIKVHKPRVRPRWHPVTGDKTGPEIDLMFELAHRIAAKNRQLSHSRRPR